MGDTISLTLWMRNLPGFKRDAQQASGAIDGIGRAADRAGHKADQASRRTGGLGAGIAGIARSGAMKAGAAGIVAMAGGIALTGVKFEAMKEQAHVAFTTMLGDSGKATAMLNDLQNFAQATPFELPGLIQSSQRLLAMGFAAKDVKPMLTSVGDAAAGLGLPQSEMDGMITALGQMKAKGKATSEEMMQLTERGVPAWQMLAKSMGVDTATAMKMVENGAVKADTAIGAVTRGMNQKFGGLMAKQSQTLAGQWSSIKDGARQAAGNLVAPFIPQLKRLTEWLNKTLADPDVQAGIKHFSEQFISVSQSIGEFLIPIIKTARDITVDTINAITEAFQKAQDAYNWIRKNTWNRFSHENTPQEDALVRDLQRSGVGIFGYPATKTTNGMAAGAAAGGITVPVTVTLDGKVIATATANRVADRNARR